MPNNKKARRELAIKKAKLKRRIIISLCSVLVLAFIAAVIITVVFNAGTQTYSDGYATVELRPNGKFSAVLYHNERYNGVYTTSESGGATLIHLSYNDITAIAMVTDMGFIFPDEWFDDHGHGSVLPER